MKTKDPYGNEIIDLYHLRKGVKEEIMEWIKDHEDSIDSGYFTKNWSEDEKKGYRTAMRHLKVELNQHKIYL